jgi:lambda repressor-like predicted transcriptional regulator
MSYADYIPTEWLKESIIKALSEGGNSLVEDVANELSQKQLTNFIRILVKVHDRKKIVAETIEVEVINQKEE